MLQTYKKAITGVHFTGESPTLAAAKKELINGLEGLLGQRVVISANQTSSLLVGTTASNAVFQLVAAAVQLQQAGDDFFYATSELLNITFINIQGTIISLQIEGYGNVQLAGKVKSL